MKVLKLVNPLFIIHQKINRVRNNNKDFTLLSSNCLGGIIYHELGVRFYSPTINVRFDSPDFIRFVSNIQHYLNESLVFIDADVPYPVALLGDVKINFVHYNSEQEAMEKWNERCKRINWDNVWILTNDLDGVTDDDLEKLNKVNYSKGIVVFSTRKSAKYSFIHMLPTDKNGEMVNIMRINRILGRREIERYFDYVGWLNSIDRRNNYV